MVGTSSQDLSLRARLQLTDTARLAHRTAFVTPSVQRKL